MNIVFITELDVVNHQGAALVRIQELAKAITYKSNNKVYITSLLHSNKDFKLGTYDNKFEIYTVGEIKNDARNFSLRRFFSYRKKQLELDYIINNITQELEITVFIVYNFLSTFYDEFATINKLHKSGFKVLAEKNELSRAIALNLSSPAGNKSLSFFCLKTVNILNGLLIDKLIRLYDGGFVISSFLEKFVKRRTMSPFIIVPILYPTINKIEDVVNTNRQTLRIGYFGTITIKRDQIMNILKAVKLLVEYYKLTTVKFSMTGSGSVRAISTIREYINENKLSGIVTFYGLVDSDKLLAIQASQDVLIVLRDDSLQGKSSFSTKLANYMHLGKIVLANDISDNSEYLQNAINGFLIQNTRPETIAQKLYQISCLNTEDSENIKKNAKNTAMNYFYYKNYAQKIQSFLEGIQKI